MKKITRKEIKNFILANRFSRRINFFLNYIFFPFLVKATLVTLTLFVLIYGTLKIFKPTYLDKIYKKSSFYFFHYLNLDNHEFSKINIVGNNRVKEEEIIEIIKEAEKHLTVSDQLNRNYQPLIQRIITRIKQDLPWVNRVVIIRNMPNNLNITITEYEPFAIWQDEGKKYVIDREGNAVLSENLEEFKHMVVLSGKGANIHARSLFNIFTIDPKLSSEVYSATWVGGRRWNIRLNNGLLIKLPERNINEAWQRLIKIYNTPGSIVGLKIIDLRIGDKLYLEYDDSVIKEIKNL